jgi:hypothetical protein
MTGRTRAAPKNRRESRPEDERKKASGLKSRRGDAARPLSSLRRGHKEPMATRKEGSNGFRLQVLGEHPMQLALAPDQPPVQAPRETGAWPASRRSINATVRATTSPILPATHHGGSHHPPANWHPSPDTSTTPANPATWRAALAWFHAGEGSRIKTEGYGRHPMRSPYIPVNQPNGALTPGGRAGLGPDTHRSRGVPFGIDIVCAGGLACLAKHARLCRCRLAKTHFVLS